MSLPPDIKKYLSKSPEAGEWKLSPAIHGGIKRAVVIPALAESASLLKTLASLAGNAPEELGSTIIICVINNRRPAISAIEEIEDNFATLAYLKQLSSGMEDDAPPTCPDKESFNKVRKSGMRLAFVDASTPGNELPDKGGVGIARKIGMDLALEALEYDGEEEALIICLDADTLVETNYLAEIRRYFACHHEGAAVVAFRHILPEDEENRPAAVAYELFLRYYEAGLSYAKSPYAYQTIGSTMVCRADAYAAVGGMNRRRAGEDFYFLQNLAKYSAVGHIGDTMVYPSMRVSDRVPFGTGRKMGELAGKDDKSIPFYNPDIFEVMKRFIAFLDSAVAQGMSGREALECCRRIDALLADYLAMKSFDGAWDKIRLNSKGDERFRKNLHVWFDAFQTFKLAHHLRDNGYGNVAMLPAARQLFSMAEMAYEAVKSGSTEGMEEAEQMLCRMRE